MTDNEIIKILECCRKPVGQACKECPLNSKGVDCLDFDVDELILDLINRQKAEIEALIAGQETLQKYRDEEINRLEIELKAMRGAANSYKAEVERLERSAKQWEDTAKDLYISRENIKAEAVKEFAERLKEKATPHYFDNTHFAVKVEEIDNLVKEMVGEG